MWPDRGYPGQQEPGALHRASDVPQPLLACSFSTSLLSWFCTQQTLLLVGLSGQHENKNLCPSPARGSLLVDCCKWYL